jgi:hypothetical protein
MALIADNSSSRRIGDPWSPGNLKAVHAMRVLRSRQPRERRNTPHISAKADLRRLETQLSVSVEMLISRNAHCDRTDATTAAMLLPCLLFQL